MSLDSSDHRAILYSNASALLIITLDGAGWFHDEFRRAGKDPAYAAWSFPTSANPRIDQELIEAERKRLPEDVFAPQYEAQFVGVPVERCDTCLGPTPGVPTFVMIQGYDEPGTCPACGRLTDSEGRSIVPLRPDGTEGTPRIIRIVPGRGAEDPPEMPS